jgi:hypothetical protein
VNDEEEPKTFSPQSFPRIHGRVVEVVDGFTVSVWLNSGPSLAESLQLNDQPVASIEEARSIVMLRSKERGIPASNIDIITDLHGFLPEDEKRH